MVSTVQFLVDPGEGDHSIVRCYNLNMLLDSLRGVQLDPSQNPQCSPHSSYKVQQKLWFLVLLGRTSLSKTQRTPVSPMSSDLSSVCESTRGVRCLAVIPIYEDLHDDHHISSFTFPCLQFFSSAVKLKFPLKDIFVLPLLLRLFSSSIS